ncbi:Predicted DNA-binding transcriptional regulator YafY, contains an HTH and WYL domains [Quadrisphaera granulorum]|uniref:Putative DNA-binding transcriptional regulator YafY n=1 Tax=Quadrisphaera granulorum TaxID=317664 RepID=A0A315ZPH8_9ACTN|nr:WYL domain-containing protein [Quadrisphaera granulorum]PWJ47461.1 putative DNA-binding transcriptional regulator YafY [Quadrisphaera granulorum]SZE98762.1 Predicted DNA-binding transcriptional regulator YafY, contains an HTH and WYL domains [Quadrisphaera granulorum]
MTIYNDVPVRADRLVSLVLLLRQRGRMTAPELAAELEVSVRTVMRDVESLSTAGVPVYAERGRHGGFALLPGFRTELTGLTDDEATALLAATSRGGHLFGLHTELGSAVRKVLDAVPGTGAQRVSAAARRFLVEPDTDLLARRQALDEVAPAVLAAVREAVVSGRRLRLDHVGADGVTSTRTVDPIGLVTSRGRHYLLARRSGEDRTYRLSRISSADVLPEEAVRDDDVDLAALWRERSARFRAGEQQVRVRLSVAPARLAELLATAVSVLGDEPLEEVAGAGVGAGREGWRLLDVTFQDDRHARWAVWTLGLDAEVLDPPWLREQLRERALALAVHYARDLETR